MWANEQGAVFTTHADIRREVKHASLPAVLTDEIIAAQGFSIVTLTAEPEHNADTQIAESSVALVNGVWTQQWAVRNLTSEELQARVPQSVTMRQARLALLGAGVLSAVDAAIAALDEPARTAAQIAWEYSTEVQRSFGLVSQLAAALGLTDAQIDALFVAAAKL